MEEKKIDIKTIIDEEQRKKIKIKIVFLREYIKKFFSKKENNQETTLIIAIIITGITIYSLFSLYTEIQTLNKKSNSLEEINQYSTTNLKTNNLTRNYSATITTINEAIQKNEDIEEEIERYSKYKENLQFPYNNFLQYFLLPPINIRKNYFTNEINIDILGKDFLEKNPYNDTNLIQKRSEFFSTTPQNETNQIKKIEIGNIKEYENDIFGIQINISFIAPSKNALLFLIDKITTTSDEKNISLLGEFFYHLRQQIKTDKEKIIQEKIKNNILNKETDSNKIIGYELYNRIKNDKETDLIDETTINRTIFNIMNCSSDEKQEKCLYTFREKFKNIATLAYGIGGENTNKKEAIKNFLKELPPIISIQEFNYHKKENNEIITENGTNFEGDIKLEFYGKNINEEEFQKIIKKLGQQCFGEETELSLEKAKNTIEEYINKQTNIIYENEQQENSIREIKKIIEKKEEEYGTLNNYKKTIRIFEIYRILNENGLCKTI